MQHSKQTPKHTPSNVKFVTKLIERTLDDLGYPELLAQLYQQAHQPQSPLLWESNTDDSLTKTMHSLCSQLYNCRYSEVADFLTKQIKAHSNNELSQLVAPTREPGLVAMIILYLVQRFQFVDHILFGSPSSSSELMKFVDTVLFDTLDCLQPSLEEVLRNPNGSSTRVTEIFDRNVLMNLNRDAELKILTALILDLPFDEGAVQEAVKLAKYTFGFGIQSSTELTSRELMSRLLVDTLLARAFNEPHRRALAGPPVDIPSNYLETLLEYANLWQDQQNPYYLPPRTRLEASMLNNNDPYFAIRHPLIATNDDSCDGNSAPFLLLYDLRQHSNQVWFAKFSPLGKWLLTGSRDGKLIVYDVLRDFKVIRTLETTKALDAQVLRQPSDSTSLRPVVGKLRLVRACCWDESEKYVVACYMDGMVRVWNVGFLDESSNRVPRRPVSDSMVSSGPTTEQKLVLCFMMVGLAELVINPTSCAFIGPDKFIVGSDGKALRAFDVQGTELFDFYGNIDGADDDEDVSGDADDDLGLSLDDEVTEPKARPRLFAQKLTGVLNRINALAVTPNKRFVVTTDTLQKIQFFSIPELFGPEALTEVVCLFIIAQRTDACCILALGRQLLVSVGDGELHLFNIDPLNDSGGEVSNGPFQVQLPYLERKFYGHSCAKDLLRACFGYNVEPTGNDELVLCGSDDGAIFVWKARTGQLMLRIAGHEGPCNMVDWNTNGFVRTGAEGLTRDYGKLWCLVGDDGFVKIWGPSNWFQ